MLCGIIVLFGIIVLRLFSLQVVHGEEHRESVTTSISKELAVPAPRGGIYDRYGRPLAVNQVAYSVQVDGSVTLAFSDEERHALAAALTEYLISQNTLAENTLPISMFSPYHFQFEGTPEEQEKQEK